MRIVQSGLADPTQFDSQSDYYDPKSSPDAPRWHTVEVEIVEAFSEPISLPTLKQEFRDDQLLVVKRGNRLSVMPVAGEIAPKILALRENVYPSRSLFQWRDKI